VPNCVGLLPQAPNTRTEGDRILQRSQVISINRSHFADREEFITQLIYISGFAKVSLAMPDTLPSLLLLPPPPAPVTVASLSAAYRRTISASITSLSRLPTSSKLIIVLPCPSIHDRLHLPRSHVYDELQGLLAGIYSLVCIVCAQLGVDVESDTPGSIDARIILLDYDMSMQTTVGREAMPDLTSAGPVVDLSVLAMTRRHWHFIFSVDGEHGQRLLATYLELGNRQSPPILGHIQTIGGGVSLLQKQSPNPSFDSSFSHNVVAVGGTFDHLHAGHKLLLTATALLLQPMKKDANTGRRLIVGITGDELLKNKKYAEHLKSWKKRQDDVVDFLLSILLFTRSTVDDAIQVSSINKPVPNGQAIHTKLKACNITIECVEIQDPFGPTISDENVTALVVSGETRSGGQAVNDKRKEKGWNPLEIFEIDVLNARENNEDGGVGDNFASKISSSAIRKRKAEHARSSSL
jgi:phosphopantetheine adenylyltransferase